MCFFINLQTRPSHWLQTAALLYSVLQDRELNLADGSRFLRHDRFDELAKDIDKNSEEMSQM